MIFCDLLVIFVGMKKINAFLLGLCVFGFAQAQQTLGLVHGNEETFFVDENLPDGFKSCKIKFFNKSQSDIVINYKQISLDFPETWLISFCDNRDCLPNFPLTGTYAAIKPGDTTDMKLDVFPSGAADSAVVKYAVWDANNSSIIDTLTFNIYARWGLNTTKVNTLQTRVFPNPNAISDLSITGNTLQHVRIFAIDGRKVWEQSLDNQNEAIVPMNALSNGTYFLKVQHAMGVDQHTLQVNR